MNDILIVGAGIAGLACAGRLVRSGLRPILLDKGRGVGGRVATRRAGSLQFDHGAQYVTARTAGFAGLLDELVTSGHLASWDDGSGRARMVGIPGMSALAKALASGLDLKQNVQVTAVRRNAAGWSVQTGHEAYLARRLVITTPPSQAMALLGDGHPLSTVLAGITMEPCLSLMATIAGQAPFPSRYAPDDDLPWIARDDGKPGRPAGDAVAWVAQAGAAFSAAHLELAPDDAARLLLPMLCQRLGLGCDKVRHAQVHRWRFARVRPALGRPFLRDSDGTLHIGGDWCLGRRVEDAWASGKAMAEDVLAQIRTGEPAPSPAQGNTV